MKIQFFSTESGAAAAYEAEGFDIAECMGKIAAQRRADFRNDGCPEMATALEGFKLMEYLFLGEGYEIKINQ